MLDRTIHSSQPGDAADAGPLDAFSRAVAAVVDEVGPAVVRVGGGRGGGGSGVIIAGDGLVLTNSHVVGGSRRAMLQLAEGHETEAVVVGDDPDTDLALLRAINLSAIIAGRSPSAGRDRRGSRPRRR